MNLNDHLEKIIEGIIAEINANVTSRIDTLVYNAINAKLSAFNFEAHIQQAAIPLVESKIAEYNLDTKKLEKKVVDRINETLKETESNTVHLLNESVKNYIQQANFPNALANAIRGILLDQIDSINFPEKSIGHNAINFNDFTLSGDNIVGGIIKQFSSTGIDDRATNVALTILDEATVVENNLLTKDLTVEGSMTVNGNFIVNGAVDEESTFYKNLVHQSASGVVRRIDSNLFDNYSSKVFDKIKENGLDLTKITVNQQEIIKNNSLGASIVESNLQKLGLVRELQVSGETILAESLYVTKGRIGINTIEPSAALAVWDDEIEITASKRQKDVGSIGTPRQQKLVLFANNKENAVLEPDGSVTVNDLRIGPMRFTAADRAPNFVSERNHVVWNTNPNPGGPMGWVCLGGSNWANFGIID